MKRLLLVLVLFSVLGCKNSNFKELSKEGSTDVNSEIKYDSQILKNGEELIFFQTDSTYKLSYIKKNKVPYTDSTIKEVGLSFGKKGLGRLKFDLNENFILSSRFGSNPERIEIFRKESFSKIADGTNLIYENTKKGIIIFENNDSEKNHIVVFVDDSSRVYKFRNTLETCLILTGSCWTVDVISECSAKLVVMDNLGISKEQTIDWCD